MYLQMASTVVESKLGKSLDDLIADARKQAPKKSPGKKGAKVRARPWGKGLVQSV